MDDFPENTFYVYGMSAQTYTPKNTSSHLPSLHEDWVDEDALKIVKILQREQYETYFVGGCVRDLLLGIHPKDYDIATNALPQQVKKRIPWSYIIGKRFRLVLVRRGDAQYEIATFRKNVPSLEIEDETESDDKKNGHSPQAPVVIVGDNFFGTAIEDAQRRDFTINGLFYDPSQHKVIDFVHGLDDLQTGYLRMIGDPKTRLIEDPIRILRAIRLSHKIIFSIEPALRLTIKECASELKKSALPRRREEYIKILKLNEPILAFLELYDLGVLVEILPSLNMIFSTPERLNIFQQYFDRTKSSGINTQDPIESIGAFLFSYLKSFYLDKTLNLEVVEKNTSFKNLLRSELNIFKSESSIFYDALALLPLLKNVKEFQRKGERRKSAFLRADGFLLALKFSHMEMSLTHAETHFWLSQIESPSTQNKNVKTQDPSQQHP